LHRVVLLLQQAGKAALPQPLQVSGGKGEMEMPALSVPLEEFRSAPSSEASFEICSDVRLSVPSVSSAAVIPARPGRSGGLAAPPASVTSETETMGSSWRSTR